MHSVFLTVNNSSQGIAKADKVVLARVPFKKWPAWAMAISILKKESDAGVGDTVYRVIGPANSAAYKRWYLAAHGKSCGCVDRRQRWNRQFSYGHTPTESPSS